MTSGTSVTRFAFAVTEKRARSRYHREVEYNVDVPSTEPIPKATQRQLFYLGVGMYAAVLLINLVFLITFESSPSQYGAVRILAPALTVVFTIADAAVLRSVVKKQYPTYPDLLAKWPLNVPEYPIWICFACLGLSYGTSVFFLSRI